MGIGLTGAVCESLSFKMLLSGEVSWSWSRPYSRMMSVADGDPPQPLPLSPSVSVSVSRSASESGFVTIIRLVVTGLFGAMRESAEEKAQRATDGRFVSATVANTALGICGSRSGLERADREEGDIGGETKTVYRRATCNWTGGEGCGVGIGVKYESCSKPCP